MKKMVVPSQSVGDFRLPEFCVSFVKDQKELLKSLSMQEINSLQALYVLAEISPKKALKDTLDFYEKHPSIPEVISLLTYIYIRKRKIKKAEKLIQESFEKNPHHLISRINYADQCLRKKDLKTIDSIFNGIYELDKLYPEKKCFHVTEFRSFMLLMGRLSLFNNNKERAILYHYLARSVDQKHPGTIALGKKIYKRTLIQRIKGK